MDELVAKQTVIAGRIQDAIRNFAKDGSDRKSISYLEQRLNTLDASWTSFAENNQQINKIAEQHQDHPYLVNSVFAQTKQMVGKFREDLTALWREKQSHNSNKPANDKTSQQADNDGDGKGASSSGAQYQEQQPSPRRQKRFDSEMQAIRRLLNAINVDRRELQSKAYYQVMVKTLGNHWKSLQQMHAAILEDELYVNYDPEYFINIEEEVVPVVIELQTRLDDADLSSQDLGEGAPVLATGSSLGCLNIKLPKMTLPVFKGDYLQWKQFEELFSEIIGKQRISNTQKLMYLKANLDGEPRNLIHHLQITENNYQAAWDILCSRYENKRLIVTGLLDKLLTQSTVQSDSAAAIKELHDTTLECLSALTNMGMPTAEWSSLLHHMLIKKIDKVTHGLYEQSLLVPREVPQLEDLLKFLELRFQALEALGSKNRPQATDKNKKSVYLNTTKDVGCINCKGNHMVNACSQFLKLTPSERYQRIISAKACINCLKEGHWTVTCRARKCTKCSRKHNTLLHQDEIRSNEQPASSPAAVVAVSSLAANSNNTHVFLGTVIAYVTDHRGKSLECRILLDSGSQLNFITDRLYRQLGLRHQVDTLNISGIGRSQLQASKRVNVSIQSRHSGFAARLEAFVLPKIASEQPNKYIDTKMWEIPKNIHLADPLFNQPRRIDMLLGAEFFCSLLSVGQIRLGETLPTLQNTVFGWIIVGRASDEPSAANFCGISVQEDMNLDTQVKKFWELEDVEPSTMAQTTVERDCEAYFESTTTRDESGRFIVRLPFTNDPSCLGQSSEIAIRRFFSLERRLNKDPVLKKQYVDFINEYLDLNHMEEIGQDQLTNTHYILPHHCVLRPESTTTKLRVVFDASAKTSNNIALNEILATGPTIQNDLFSILTRFRTHRFVFTGDIAKMYRQILIDEKDRNMQIIVWRNNENEDLKYYRLRTVTYGTTSAPYLSIKCLQVLGNQYADICPNGSRVIKEDFYVDDLMTGCDDLKQAKCLQAEIINILKAGGFDLRKWCANHQQLLQDMPAADCQLQFDIDDGTTGQIKALGVTWLPKADQFAIKTSWEPAKRVTKRSILADIAHVFDPLGFVNPVIVLAKIFIQELWSLRLDWDSAVPVELHTKWLRFRDELAKLNELKIPRHVLIINPIDIQIHAFSDASEKAYGAAIYVRSINANGQVLVRLLCAKSKVAPKKTVTLPRLELCAAKLTAQLANRVTHCLNIQVNKTVYWTDSSIVLSWLQAESSTYKTFVANRVAAIQELTKHGKWMHISTKLNPADLVSRGVFPEQLTNSTIWFEGPDFLKTKEEDWPIAEIIHQNSNMEERKRANTVLLMQRDQHFVHRIDHRNSFQHLKKVVAQILRFTKNVKVKQEKRKTAAYFNIYDLKEAERVILKELQAVAFRDEIAQLKRNQTVLEKSSLAGLTPFLEDGLIRVGGRIQAADIPFDAKHPILIPSHEISRILMSDLHHQHLHAGPQLLLSVTRQRYWPLQGKNLARSVVHKCVLCARVNPKQITQRMGNLPEERLQPARPFLHVGVDFCGPIEIHYRLRGKRATKSFIAVFVCFTTKAVHLEVSSDLTTAAFIGCLKRFIGRRGLPSKIFCDNATNFVGAKNELAEWNDILKTEDSQTEINKHCTQKGIDWQFIPARAPHFGGLWEAAVKSTKHHLKGILHTSSLTFEELATLTTEIEAILNSRPLTAMSDDPNDLQPLTPGHFLIGEPMTSIPGIQTFKKTTTAKRWNAIQVHKSEFWKRWSVEYLSELQRRNKWRQQKEDISPGKLVILKEDNIPPLQWRTGRVIKTIKGSDGLTRVVEIKTSTGLTTRAIHRICPLPIDEKEEIIEDSEITAKGEKLEPSPHTVLNATYTRPHKLKGRFLPINNNWKPRITAKRKSEEIIKDPVKKAAPSMLFWGILALLVIPILGTPEEAISFTPFKTQPGIFFENMGRASIMSSEWKLIVYFNMRNYWNEFDNLQPALKHLRFLCNTSPDQKKHCYPILMGYQRQINELTNNNEIFIYNDRNEKTSRRKRAPLNIVGNVARAIFGILDDEYASDINTSLAHASENDDLLLDLIKNQTSVLESTANILSQDEHIFNDHLETIQNQISEVMYQTNNITIELEAEKVEQMLLRAFLHLSIMISSVQRTQMAILQVTTDTQHGTINPLLMTPKQLKTATTFLKEHLPSNLRLPGSEENINLGKLYKLMTIHGRLTREYTIFTIRVPLLLTDQFEIYNLVPVPTQINMKFVSIKPSTDYLGINLHRDQYYPISELALSQCTETDEERYLCKQRHPVYTTKSQISDCEITIMNRHEPPPSCEIVTSNLTSRWIQLKHANHWIYSIANEESINIVCGSTILQKTISGSGILTINDNCVIRQDHIIIYSHKVEIERLDSSYLPPMNLSDIENISESKFATLEKHIITQTNHSDQLNKIHQQLAGIKEGEAAMKSLQPHDHHQFAVIYICLALIVSLALIIYINKRRHQKPIPAPRTVFNDVELGQVKAGEDVQ